MTTQWQLHLSEPCASGEVQGGQGGGLEEHCCELGGATQVQGLQLGAGCQGRQGDPGQIGRPAQRLQTGHGRSVREGRRAQHKPLLRCRKWSRGLWYNNNEPLD